MKIIATSDMHGHLPKIPECDLLIIAGDVCPISDHALDYQMTWLDHEFRDWLRAVPAQSVIGIAGNHDFCFEKQPIGVSELHLPWHYLQDSGIEIEGLKFYGIPWVPNLPGWAFFAPSEQLKSIYEAVPDDTDIVITHGPPNGYLDNRQRRYGSWHVNHMLKQVKPKHLICGHVHEGYGHRKHRSGVDIWNVSHCNINYLPVNPPVAII